MYLQQPFPQHHHAPLFLVFSDNKNQLGLFSTPRLVVCDNIFLGTLPDEELLWGKAEMLKHGLITGEVYWNKFQDLSKLSLVSMLSFCIRLN